MGRRIEMVGGTDSLRRSAKEAQGFRGGDQVGRGGHEGGPLPQGGEAAAGSFDVSVNSRTPFFLLFSQHSSKPFLVLSTRALLSLERTTAASIVGGAGGSASSRRVDPRAEIQAATERNTREAREEQEAEDQRAASAKAAQEMMTESAEAQADAATKAQAEAAAA